MSEHDYSEFREAPPEDLVGKITLVARAQKKLRAEVDELGVILAKKSAELKLVEESTLPTLMDNAGLKVFKTQDGELDFELKEKIRASISKDNPFPAFKWLEDNGHARMINNEFIIDFDPKSNPAWAKEFEAFLKEKGINYKKDKSVHPSTLQSAVSKMLEAGVDVPKDLFNIFRQRFCKV